MKILLILLLLPFQVFAISSKSAIVMDMDSNRIIFNKDINRVQSVASISKIMTAIIAIESNKMDEIVTIGEYIKNSYGSGIYIKENEKIKLSDLVYGLMLRSGNDAALAIAHHVSGNVVEFVKLMNDKAKKLKMYSTEFNNPSGLDEIKGNYSSCYDMAILMSYAMKNQTFKNITGTKNYKVKTTLNYYNWTNKNKLLKNYKYATGGKTGYTDIAKRTLVTTASKNNTNLVTVTLNDSNDFINHQNLFENAFKKFTTYKILEEGKFEVLNEKFYKNRQFFIKENFSYPLKENEKDKVIIKIKMKELYNYKDKQEVGEVNVYLENKKIFSTKMYISINKIKINIFEKIMELIK